MLTSHLRLKVEGKTECLFLTYRILVRIKHLPLLSTVNLPFSGFYTHFDSFLPSTYKLGTVYTLAYRFMRICTSWTKLHTELVCLKIDFS